MTDALSEKASAERRRTKRISLTFQIEVSGCDPRGITFHERTVTVDVNEHGCKFSILRQLDREELISIRCIGQNDSASTQSKPVLFKVVWIEPGELGWIVGALKLQAETVWPLKFPEPPKA